MLSRSIAGAIVALLVALPLTARADLWINYKNLTVITAQRGCHSEGANKETKTSVLRCGPYEMTSSPHFITYTETWGRLRDDPRYSGCSTQAWTIALPPAKHQFNISVNNSDRAPIVCKYNWVNNNTVDVYFIDKIPAQPLRIHAVGITDIRSLHMYNSGLCAWQAPNDPSTSSCKTAGDVALAVQTSGGMKQLCKVKVSPVLYVIIPVWHVQFASNGGACQLRQVDNFNYNVTVKT